MATFDTAAELSAFLHRMHDEGEFTTLAMIDARGNVWMTCALPYTFGLGCWIVGGLDPRQLQPLGRAKYPMVMLVEPTPDDPWKCPRCGDWFTGHSPDRYPICDACLKAVNPSDR